MGTMTRVGDGGSSVAVADAAAETMRRIVDCCRSDMINVTAIHQHRSMSSCILVLLCCLTVIHWRSQTRPDSLMF